MSSAAINSASSGDDMAGSYVLSQPYPHIALALDRWCDCNGPLYPQLLIYSLSLAEQSISRLLPLPPPPPPERIAWKKVCTVD